MLLFVLFTLLYDIVNNINHTHTTGKECLLILAKLHAFSTRESLRKHDLQKPNCETLRKVYLLLAPLPPGSGWARSSTLLIHATALFVVRPGLLAK